MEVTAWQGGKPVGRVRRLQGSVHVVFHKCGIPNMGYTKFYVTDYGSMEKTIEAAEAFQHEVSLKHKKVRNQWRIVKVIETAVEYVEVQLTQDCVTMVNLEDLPAVESRVWCAKSNGHRMYVYSNPKKHLNEKYICLHNVILDVPMVDHISGDGLDNRRQNIRPTTYQLNNRNQAVKASKKRVQTGVGWTDKTYYAMWREDGVNRTRHFAIKKYGKDEAERLAIEVRVDADRRVGYTFHAPAQKRKRDDANDANERETKRIRIEPETI